MIFCLYFRHDLFFQKDLAITMHWVIVVISIFGSHELALQLQEEENRRAAAAPPQPTPAVAQQGPANRTTLQHQSSTASSSGTKREKKSDVRVVLIL